jgi:ABC-type multidrug transport system fused ATPase/permease subunit
MEDLFDGTLAENVSMGRDYITNREVLRALRLVGLEDFVKELPEGLLTHIIPGGKRIPISIARRIILSRSFAQNPPLLLLDNFPSAIEQRVNELSERITDEEARWTAVVASNHKAMASRCDRIIVMEKGRIAFDGTWEAVKQHPTYRKLYQ